MTSTAGMDCDELVELVTDYLEGALSEEDRVRFEAHLEVCEGCATYLEQMRTTIRLTGRLTGERMPEEARKALLAAFRGWRPSR